MEGPQPQQRYYKSRLIRVIKQINTHTLYSQETNDGLNSSIQYIEDPI